MQKLHLGLVHQLGQLETRQIKIGDAISEVTRRIAVLDEVMSWSDPESESEPEFSQEEHPQEAVFYGELPSEEIFQEEIPSEEMVTEELPQEEMFQEELPREEMVTEELPQEEMFQEELPSEEMVTEELPQEESSEEEEPLEEEVSQGDEFRQLDTEGTDIQWVNR